MFRKNRPDLDILNGPILSGMFRFAIPFAVSLIFTMCFNIADVIVVGKFAGAAALAAVGATSAPISVLVQSFSSLSLGVNVVVAQHLGSGQLRRAQNAIHTAVLFSLLLGLLLCVVGYLVCTPMLLAMNTRTQDDHILIRFVSRRSAAKDKSQGHRREYDAKDQTGRKQPLADHGPFFVFL